MADDATREPIDWSVFEVEKPSHIHILRAQATIMRRLEIGEVQRTENFKRIEDALGKENDTLSGGTGILGRLARIESRLRVADRWLAMIVGGVTVAGGFATALWWVIGDKLGRLLKPV